MPDSYVTPNDEPRQPSMSLTGFGEDTRGNTPAMMTSLEIAELTGKRHDNVRRTIEMLAEKGVIQLPQIEEIATGARAALVYVLSGEQGKRDSYIIVAQLSPEFTARLVDRWQELEGKQVVNPALLSRMQLLQLAMEAEQEVQLERGRRLALQDENAAMAPKVAAFERIASTDGSFAPTDAAKTLGQAPRQFIAWLRLNRWTYRRLGSTDDVAYEDKLKAGLLVHKSQTVLRLDGTEKVVTRARVTPKGLAKLAITFGVTLEDAA